MEVLEKHIVVLTQFYDELNAFLQSEAADGLETPDDDWVWSEIISYMFCKEHKNFWWMSNCFDPEQLDNAVFKYVRKDPTVGGSISTQLNGHRLWLIAAMT